MLHSAGASVVFGDMDKEAGEKLAQSLSDRVSFVHINVTRYEDHVMLFKRAQESYGKWFDPKLKIDDVEKPETDVVLDVNLKGSAYFARVALPYLKHGGARTKGNDKSITFLSSITGFMSSPDASMYQVGQPFFSVSKHGILGLVRTMSVQDPQQEVRTNALCPSFVATNMTTCIKDAWEQAGLPINHAEDIAKMLLGLSSQDVHGRVVLVENGKAWDIEQGLIDTMEKWLGTEALGNHRRLSTLRTQ
ncbi:MAG: hypothetical protein M1831_006311 [Alyxoria varia]|nr:MAG: hypothetical protein M1831_006311 [Alyxoria varia]